MKTILVIGGAGFIGSNLCIELLANNNNMIICIDNLYTGSKDNLKSIWNHDNFYFIEHDIINPFHNIFLYSHKRNHIFSLEYQSIDEIYHLACPASPEHYQKNPYYTLQTCLLGTHNVLQCLQKLTRLIVASTSEVYGDPLEHPQTEYYRGNVSTLGIRSCYDEGKRAMESMIMAHIRQFSSNIGIVRIFNTYGTQMSINDGRVISNFCLQVLQNQNITIYGNGLQTRSFCYIDDLLNGLIKMMNSNEMGPINLGNTNESTIKEIAECLIKLTNSTSKIIYKELPLDDPIRRCPDITQAKYKLNWNPTTSLTDGLTKTLNYFKMKLEQ